MRIREIEPTVFFVRDQGRLLHRVDLETEGDVEDGDVLVHAVIGGEGSDTPVERAGSGRATHHVYVPAVTESAEAEFQLVAAGRVVDRRSLAWQPQRRWDVYMVPNSHHDFGYTNVIENVLKQYDTFYEDALRFCEETDDWPEESRFHYMVDGAWSLQHFVSTASADSHQRLRKYVREGRIEIQALYGNFSTALCGPEELVRLMYPSFRLARDLGGRVTTASITDVPGLAWALPSVLARAGVRHFFAGLPDYFQWGRNDIHTFWDESAIVRHDKAPDAFHWQGPDDESVLVYYQGGYGCWIPRSYDQAVGELPGMLRDMEKGGCPFSVVRYGALGCYDNTPPDLWVSEMVREWSARWAYPRLQMGTHATFFQALEEQCVDLRTFRGELPETDYIVGALSTAKETSLNRVTHDRLLSAETAATVASLIADGEDHSEALRDAYDQMMMYDEHTWGMAPGMGALQDWDWSDKAHRAYKAAGVAHDVGSRSLQAVARAACRADGADSIVVFNPLAAQRTDVVRIPRFAAADPFALVDETTGAEVAHQVVALRDHRVPVEHGPERFGRSRFDAVAGRDLVFIAEDVPPMGWRTYRMVPRETTVDSAGLTDADGCSLESPHYRLTVDPATGALASLYDKGLDRELVDPAAPHGLNELVVRTIPAGETHCPQNIRVGVGERGPVYNSLLVTSEAPGAPQVTQEIILYRDMKRVDLANRLLKDATPLLEHHFAFPFAFERPQFRYEGPNAVVRPFVDQFPGSNTNYYAVQHWAHVSDGEAGVVLAPVDSHILQFGGLWPCYTSQAHHGLERDGYGADFVPPEAARTGLMYSYVLDSNFRTNFPPHQQGDFLFRYSLTSHAGDWQASGADAFGWSVGNPLAPTIAGGNGGGQLDNQASFAQVDPPGVRLSAVKRAEDGEGVILRLYDLEGRDQTATVTLPLVTIEEVHVTNPVEETIRELPSNAHAVQVPISASAVTTVRLKVRSE